jgi:hypothetical protein
VWYYALPLGLIVFAVGFRVAVLVTRRRMMWSHPQLVLLGVGTFCALLYTVAPGTFSGGTGFDQRFPIFAVLFILAALGSSAAFEQGRYRRAVIVFTIAVSMASLIYQIEFCRHYQAALDLYRLPPVKAGAKGAIVMDDASVFLPPGLAFGPYRWVAAHYFRHSKAVLLNSPFLYTGTMPIKVDPSSLTSLNPQGMEISPPTMEHTLASYSPTDLVDFVVFVGNPNSLPADSPFSRLCERYGFVKTWSADSVSLYVRPPSFAGIEH